MTDCFWLIPVGRQLVRNKTSRESPAPSGKVKSAWLGGSFSLPRRQSRDTLSLAEYLKVLFHLRVFYHSGVGLNFF